MTNGERMSGVDRAWMRMDRPANLMVVVALIVLDAPLPRRSLRRLIAERFLCFPRFRCLPVTDTIGAHWAVAEQFELDDHLLYTALPPPAGSEQLEAMVGELASTPLNASRPWWSFHLVSGYRGGCALIIRIHHCYADGMALMQVLLSLTEGEESMSNLPTVGARPAAESSLLAALAGGAVPGLLIEALRSGGQLAGQGLHMAMHPTEIGGAAQQAMQVAGELARLAVLPDDPRTQLKQPLSGV
ncbi:MAG: wax ester/triacylglycerol synthase family O-acyltransferase, partial [Proteobacteria bacterium]|nr:wax ester/triacylglycerol synthase family O-acyltransferase [Pseudomonadota bacterium]